MGNDLKKGLRVLSRYPAAGGDVEEDLDYPWLSRDAVIDARARLSHFKPYWEFRYE